MLCMVATLFMNKFVNDFLLELLNLEDCGIARKA
jgi:hypothetical protein